MVQITKEVFALLIATGGRPVLFGDTFYRLSNRPPPLADK